MASEAKRNCVRVTERGEEAWSVNRGPMNKNRIEGAAEKGERARSRKEQAAAWLDACRTIAYCREQGERDIPVRDASAQLFKDSKRIEALVPELDVLLAGDAAAPQRPDTQPCSHHRKSDHVPRPGTAFVRQRCAVRLHGRNALTCLGRDVSATAGRHTARRAREPLG